MRIYGPYSPIRQAGNLWFVSGQIGIEPGTQTAANDVAGQTEQTLKNLKNLLSEKGLSINQVVKTTVFLKNMTDFSAMNETYVRYFGEPRPARSCVEVSSLPKIGDTELLIEIESVAYKAQI